MIILKNQIDQMLFKHVIDPDLHQKVLKLRKIIPVLFCPNPFGVLLMNNIIYRKKAYIHYNNHYPSPFNTGLPNFLCMLVATMLKFFHELLQNKQTKNH
jgi:hypothetical protein